MTNALDLVGREFPDVNVTGYLREPVIIGAPYLLTREWTNAQVVIARQRATINNGSVRHNGANWYATPINPSVQVGEQIFGLERGDGKTNPVRRDRKRIVTAIVEGGVMAQYSTYDPFLMTVWVKADVGGADPKKDRHNPERRKLVLDRLSKEGMERIGDTGYATSAKEFFENFDLPRPAVQPTAFMDVEREVAWREMGYDTRAVFENAGVSSLRKATIAGRAKVSLPKSDCRCKDVTQEEVNKTWRHSTQWKSAKLHKVQCLWCMKPDKNGNLDTEDL